MAEIPKTVPGPSIPSAEALEPLRQTCIAFVILTTIFFVLRAISRGLIGRVPFGWDDAWIILAWILSIVVATLGLLKGDTESTTSMSNEVIVDPEVNARLLKLVFAIVQCVVAEYCTTRLSVFCLYLRLFRGKKVRMVCWVFLGFVVCQYLGFAIAGILQCRPVRYFWDKTVEGGECFPVDPFYRYTSVPNIIIDLCMVLIPIPSVWQLNTSKLRKTGLSLIFGWSLVALVASIIRLKTYMDHTVTYFVPNYTLPLMIWLVVEPGLYFIAACLPAMHHLLSKMVPRTIHDRLEQALVDTHFKSTGYLQKSSHNKGLVGISSGASHDQGFERLKDPESGLSGYIGPRRPGVSAKAQAAQRTGSTSSGSLSKSGGRMVAMDVEDGQNANSSNHSGNLPPDDLRRLRRGEGIAVHTEITITQEQQIEKILGF
ncbi:MAG: hypothetical protein M1831_005156 [Alyxoria varia]|nr:MAG: hypothetical protein M1831_005156 [Alyxoria varia]